MKLAMVNAVLAIGVVVLLTACSSGGDGGGSGGAIVPTASTVPRFAYVTNYGDDTVSMYAVNAASGQLRSLGYVTAGTNPASVTVDPSERFAYVANSGSNTISAYVINGTTGVLTAVVGSPFAAGTNPGSVTVDPSGRFAFVANRGIGVLGGGRGLSAYTINSATGALIEVAGSPFAVGTYPYSVTVDPSGRFAYVVNWLDNSGSVYTINSATGALTVVAGSSFATGGTGSGSPSMITVDPSGQFAYVVNPSFDTIFAYAINRTTGVLTAVAGSPFTVGVGMGPLSVTVDPSGQFAYLANGISNTVSAYTINRTTGALTEVFGSPFVSGTNPKTVTVDPSGRFAYVANSGSDTISAYSINSTTGALSALATGASVVARQSPMSLAMVHGTTPVVFAAKFAYAVTPITSNTVSAYTINSTTGTVAAVAGSPFATGINPRSVAVDPRERFVYVANVGSNTISAYTVNSTTGVLAAVAGSPFATGINPRSVAVDPSGRFAYVSNDGGTNESSSVSAYTINSTTGALTPVAGSPYATLTPGPNTISMTFPTSVTVDPSGRFAYVADSAQGVLGYTINSTTGALTAIAGSPWATGNGATPKFVTVDPSGRFAYVVNADSNTVSAYAIDSRTGVLTAIAGSPWDTGGLTPSTITVDPTGRFAYVANTRAGGFVSTFTINGTTGALTASSPFSNGVADSIAVDPNGQFAYVAGTGLSTVSTYAVNRSTGALTAAGIFVDLPPVSGVGSIVISGVLQ